MIETLRSAPTGPAPRRRRLGELLVESGAVTFGDVEEALESKRGDERLGTALLRLGMITESDLADALAAQLGLERVDLAATTPQPDAVERLPPRVAERHGVLPLWCEEDCLVVATADPSDVVALDDVRVASRMRSVRAMVATEAALEIARRRAYRVDATHDVLETIAEEAPPDDDVEVVDENS